MSASSSLMWKYGWLLQSLDIKANKHRLWLWDSAKGKGMQILAKVLNELFINKQMNKQKQFRWLEDGSFNWCYLLCLNVLVCSTIRIRVCWMLWKYLGRLCCFCHYVIVASLFCFNGVILCSVPVLVHPFWWLKRK